jgi:hypothetical protein
MKRIDRIVEKYLNSESIQVKNLMHLATDTVKKAKDKVLLQKALADRTTKLAKKSNVIKKVTDISG